VQQKIMQCMKDGFHLASNRLIVPVGNFLFLNTAQLRSEYRVSFLMLLIVRVFI
jgi:hypothetical protein